MPNLDEIKFAEWKHSLCTISGMLCVVTSTVISGLAGASYGSSTPVKPLISPRRACAYRPFLSVASQCSSGVATWIRKKLPPDPPVWSTVSRAACLERSYGAMGAAMTAAPALASSADTKAMRCTFLCLSSGEKPSSIESYRTRQQRGISSVS